ncbi:MAG: DUF115 domain-containing protein [Lachnospiraceae bacterium]|nr:DUF115 domain-containing protein [Lachnospiraceae bacterium]
MTKEESIKLWGNFSDTYMQTIGFRQFKKENKEDSKILKNNIKYKNIHRGKRCFVLGNGPSLNYVDFEKLRDEYVFTVNELMRHENFFSLNSNYHFIADPEYFKLQPGKEEDQKLIEIIKKMESAESAPVFFAPIEGRKNVEEYGWMEQLECSYFCSKLFFYQGFQKKIDFAKFVPCFQAVVHWAVAMAVYMGFGEIYLLGCDATNAITDIASFKGIEYDELYAYHLNVEDKEMVIERHKKRGLEATIRGYNRIFEVFRELFNWCERQGVSLVNCSAETVIESIPRKDLAEVLK